MTTTQQEEQKVTKIITVTECPTEPCAIYYIDAVFQSFVVICKNQKHADSGPPDIDIENRESGVNGGNQPHPDANLLLTDTPSHGSPTLSSQRRVNYD
jgi:hypothetical protein